MFKKFMIIFNIIFLTFIFVGCNEEITTQELLPQEPNVESGYLVDSPQMGTILHAWNWSMETIENNLEDIAIAGFSTIQISPMQPQKDYFGVASWESSWWKFYQPLGFQIATENHALGTKTDLESLCLAADEYGIKIIVDVVANHLAGGTSESLNEDVLEYEPEIYNQNLYHTRIGSISDGSILLVTKGHMGSFPDLQTENQIVQNRVLDLLKEYVDVGIDGFRFDAAKHIETPSDGEYSSDFWPTIINGVKDYATSKGIDELYIYGEILNTPGYGREYSDYVDYMAVTDNGLSDRIRNAVTTKNTSNLEEIDYLSGVGAENTLLWAESHDTYANTYGATRSISNASITKAYVVTASLKDVTSLYYVRPNETTLIGECGSYLWQSAPVTAVNRFHNYFYQAAQYISTNQGFFLNERYTEDSFGIVIVDIVGNGKVKDIPVKNLQDGYYYDEISNSFFKVKNSKISGDIGSSGIAVIYNNPYEPKPSLYVSDDGLHGSFSNTKTIEVYSHNTTSAYYSINGNEKVEFEGNIQIELSHPDLNAIITLDFELYYKDFKIEKHYEYTKSNLVITEVTVNNIDTTIVGDNQIVAWVWSGANEGSWYTGTYLDGTFVFDIEPNDDHFLLVIFPSGTEEYNWNSKLLQTNDVEIPTNGIFDGSILVWN